jgi:predicted AlkP superfamily pyrophosphatase or phosphodiesterase
MLNYFAVVLLALSVWSPVPGRPDPPRKKVLFIGIDGCRTDALKAARTPHIDSLIRDGAYSENTDILGPRTTGADTVSGPGWSNLLTGVFPDKHGAKDNKFRGTNYKEFPHFFARLKQASPSTFTASFVTWEPIGSRITSAADVSVVFEANKHEYRAYDTQAKSKACELLANKDPDAVFLYFGNVDETGHQKGFHPTVREYMAAIEEVDAHIGDVLRTIEKRPTYAAEDWLILVGTDHGGLAKDHAKGHNTPEIRKVFLIVSGRSAERGVIESPTYQVDLPVTALAHLDVAADPKWKLDGRVVGLKKSALPPR